MQRFAKFAFQHLTHILEIDRGDLILQIGQFPGRTLRENIHPGTEELSQLDQQSSHFNSRIAKQTGFRNIQFFPALLFPTLCMPRGFEL